MPYKFEDISVLIVENNRPMLELVRSVLFTFGIQKVGLALDGETGFRRFKEMNPDIVICDWMMEPMNGIALTKKIRSSEESPNRFAPIILMTGYSEKSRIITARDAGVTELLVKPFKARDLYRRISQIIERPRQFVNSEDFFGPDRRRKRQTQYAGPMRRESDSQEKAKPKTYQYPT